MLSGSLFFLGQAWVLTKIFFILKKDVGSPQGRADRTVSSKLGLEKMVVEILPKKITKKNILRIKKYI